MGRPARRSQLHIDVSGGLRYSLVDYLVALGWITVAVKVQEEPIEAGATRQSIYRTVIEYRPESSLSDQEVVAVEASSGAGAAEVRHSIGIASPRRPLGQQRDQRRVDGVVARKPGDQKVVTGRTIDGVGAEATDQDVVAFAAIQIIGTVITQQDVGAISTFELVVAGASMEYRGQVDAVRPR